MANKNNIPLKKFKKFLEKEMDCKMNRISGGHYVFSRSNLGRPFTVQTHIDPVPLFIVENARRWLGYASPEDKKEWNKLIKKL